MGKKLTAYVTVGATTYPPGVVPDEVAKEVTNPKAFATGSASPAEAPDADDTGKESGAGEPPRAGKGSGVDAWASYAKALGLEVKDDATRDELIELVDQHNSTNS
ncbi:hypothetical protein INN71_02720 [Nocardioides sp. ChNu-153]|uniref:hypothetical protein n=1 Tax=Nocardioides sp. ChNu-153 TaxID=2779364 RepID=UPI0026565B75|nr:hypothetical protein [Nocardioides sp. ChNu-153]MDN7120299.1 hypothetical protein [Nocardioides sp. ChNu-153]